MTAMMPSAESQAVAPGSTHVVPPCRNCGFGGFSVTTGGVISVRKRWLEKMHKQAYINTNKRPYASQIQLYIPTTRIKNINVVFTSAHSIGIGLAGGNKGISRSTCTALLTRVIRRSTPVVGAAVVVHYRYIAKQSEMVLDNIYHICFEQREREREKYIYWFKRAITRISNR